MSLQDQLSPREYQAARLIAEGLLDKQIAERMGRTLNGTKVLLSQVFSKVGVRGNVHNRIVVARMVWVDDWEKRDLCPECRGRKFAEALGAL